MKKSVKKFSAIMITSSMIIGTSVLGMAEETAEVPVAFTLEAGISDAATSLISMVSGMDFSWLHNAKIDFNVEMKDAWEALEYVVALNDNAILSGNGYLDLESLVELVKINELSEDYLRVDLGQMLSLAQEEMGDSFSIGTASESYMDAINAVMDEETQAALIQNYLLPFAGTVEEAGVTEFDVAYQNLSGTVSYTGFKMNLGTLADTAVAELNTLKEDADTLSILNQVSNNGEITPEMLDQSIQEIISAKEENNLESIDVEAMYGVSEDGSAMGAYLDVIIGDEIMKIADVVAFPTEAGIVGEAYVGLEDDNYGVQFEIADTYNFVLTSNHAGILKAVASVDGDESKLVITPVTDYEGAPLADFDGFVLELSAVENTDGGKAAVKVIYADEEMITISGTVGKGTPVELPDLSNVEGIDINNEDAMNTWAESIDHTSFFEKLIAAGVPEDLLFGTEDAE